MKEEEKPNVAKLKIDMDIKSFWCQVYDAETMEPLITVDNTTNSSIRYTTRPQAEADQESLVRKFEFMQFKDEVLDKGGSIADYHKWKN